MTTRISTARDLEESEADSGEEYEPRQVTSTFSAREGDGRNIYIYLRPCDALEFRDLLPSEGGSTWVRVEVDMEGHRHWQVKLGPADSFGTGTPSYPPPPPPPGNSGG